MNLTATDQADTCATFSADGVHTLVLSADDGTHAVAYDAVVVHVGWHLHITHSGSTITLHFPTEPGAPINSNAARTSLRRTGHRSGNPVQGTGESAEISLTDPPGELRQFYRVRSP